jgi:DNA-binding CsgD family transcriptional regulator
MDVFPLLALGFSNAEIGQDLLISDTTVKTHVIRLLQKLKVRDRARAIVLACRCGLLDTGDDSAQPWAAGDGSNDDHVLNRGRRHPPDLVPGGCRPQRCPFFSQWP